MEMEGPFGWANMNRNTLLFVREKLKSFESMTLNDIFVRDSRNNHSHLLHQIVPEARQRLEDLKLPDVDRLWTLRLGGTLRVWGFRIQNTFFLLWWDPDHRVRPAGMRHT